MFFLVNIWIDLSFDRDRYIHPHSVLSHLYFDNALCLDAITSPDGRTEQGIRVGLSETDGATSSSIFLSTYPDRHYTCR